MKKIIIVSISLFLIVSSCKKEGSATTVPTCNKTVADIAGTYSIVKVEAGLAEPLSDITNTEIKPCQIDDKLVLNANGTSLYQDAGTACSPNGSAAGNWSIGGDGKISANLGIADVANATIVSFDCKTLVLLGDRMVSGLSVKFRVTLIK